MLELYRPALSTYFPSGSESLSVDSAAVTAMPLTMACWFSSISIAQLQALIWLGDKDSATEYIALDVNGAAGGDPVEARHTSGGTTGTGTTTTGFVADTWHHAAAVFLSTTSRSAYLDGGGKGTNTTAVAEPAYDRTGIGRLMDSTPSNGFMGGIIWPAIWNVALTDAEIVRLADGVHPATVRPENLILWDFQGKDVERDLLGYYPLTRSGTRPGMGPGFLRKTIKRPWLLAHHVAGGGGATAVPVFMQSYRRRRAG
jgi:hypothetical protein